MMMPPSAAASAELAPLGSTSVRRSAAVVTGGAGGIGQAVLARLGRDGYSPVSWDLSDHAPAATLALAVDVSDDVAVAGAVETTVRQVGPVTALVVNAGVLGPVAQVWQASPADIRRVIETNLTAAFLTVRAVVPRMLENPGPDRGRIVMISSVQAKEGTALSGPYAASKAGMIALVKVLGKELARDGILVNAITPTVVRTKMLDEVAPDRAADLLARIPMNRFLAPEEVAAMVSWLCGPDCSFSTGAVFDLSGGRSSY
jgi:NAD(P)-dependent dehydrogenase (short-subunit alcohol dehydrogenase family)